jgi:hypothetical protein
VPLAAAARAPPANSFLERHLCIHPCTVVYSTQCPVPVPYCICTFNKHFKLVGNEQQPKITTKHHSKETQHLPQQQQYNNIQHSKYALLYDTVRTALLKKYSTYVIILFFLDPKSWTVRCTVPYRIIQLDRVYISLEVMVRSSAPHAPPTTLRAFFDSPG